MAFEKLKHVFEADGVSPWVALPSAYDPPHLNRYQVFAAGELGTGAVTVEVCLSPPHTNPNNTSNPPDDVFPLPSTALSDLTTQDPPNFITKAHWARLRLADATDPDVTVWLL